MSTASSDLFSTTGNIYIQLHTWLMAVTAVGESRRPFIISHASIRTTARNRWQNGWQKQQCDADGDCMMAQQDGPATPRYHNPSLEGCGI